MIHVKQFNSDMTEINICSGCANATTAAECTSRGCSFYTTDVNNNQANLPPCRTGVTIKLKFEKCSTIAAACGQIKTSEACNSRQCCSWTDNLISCQEGLLGNVTCATISLKIIKLHFVPQQTRPATTSQSTSVHSASAPLRTTPVPSVCRFVFNKSFIRRQSFDSWYI